MKIHPLGAEMGEWTDTHDKAVVTFYNPVNIPKSVNAVRISNLNHLWCHTVLCKNKQS